MTIETIIMNYLAHGYRFLDQPLFVAGTAVPDWLSVVNRKVRARVRLVTPVVEATQSEDLRLIGKGILQHHKDDDVFHRCSPFMEMESLVGAEFRLRMPDPFDHRPGFLGHIVVELMLDAALAAGNPGLLDEFYHAIDKVDPKLVESSVNQMATRTTDKLAWFIGMFRQERFLYDYRNDEGMFLRLNQVLTRVKLPQMETDCLPALNFARQLLIDRGQELLTAVESPGGNP